MTEIPYLAGAPLGRDSDPVDTYSPSLLFPVPRAPNRLALGIDGALPFRGVDLWTAWELSWLDRRGKPAVAVARFTVPAASPALIESKSLKLYLGSFAQTAFDDIDAVAAVLAADLGAACGSKVAVELIPATGFGGLAVQPWSGESLDALEVAIDRYRPDPALLATAPGGTLVEQTLCSDLLKSNCPVTGHPDWGSVQIRYRGPQIDRVSLLRYLVSFRRHAGFHEHCVEQIWCDLKRVCAPQSLSVYARYLRRGGLDINPYRSDVDDRPVGEARLARQ